MAGRPARRRPVPAPARICQPVPEHRPGRGLRRQRGCRGCHEDRHATFRTTGMGRSMAEVDADREPADADFDHPPSGRRYEVRRQGRPDVAPRTPPGRRAGRGPPGRAPGRIRGRVRPPLADVPRRGGRVPGGVAGHLVRAEAGLGLSPGFNGPDQPGFERATGEGCLFCHAGRAEAADRSLHRMRVAEPAIGCERCHGPGSLHVGPVRRRPAAGREAGPHHRQPGPAAPRPGRGGLPAVPPADHGRGPGPRAAAGRLPPGAAARRLRPRLPARRPGPADDGGRARRADAPEPVLPGVRRP